MQFREKDIQSGICELLDWCGIPYFVTDAAIPFANGKPARAKVTKSCPDITAVLNGRAFFVEVKTPHGRFQNGQEAMHERLREAGACVVVARSIDDVAAALWRLGVRNQIINKLLEGK